MQASFRKVSLLMLVLALTAGAAELDACVSSFNRTSGSGDLIRLDGVLISDA